MKQIIRVGILVTGFLIFTNLCYSQRVVSLRAFEIHRNNYLNNIDRTEDWDDEVLYIKDVDNELDKFVGLWKGSINNRNYELSVVKRTEYKRYGDDETSWDLLKVWIIVKDNAGNLIYTNTNKSEKLNGFSGENFQTGTNIYRLNFTGRCYNDSGNAFFYISPATGKMQLHYGIISDLQSDDCPSNFVPVLPTNKEGMILTKQ